MENFEITKRSRAVSVRVLSEFGISLPDYFPQIDYSRIRTKEEILRRLFSIHAVTACAYGLDKTIALDWLRNEKLLESLSSKEKDFLQSTNIDPNPVQFQVEAIWALAWSLKIVGDIDFKKPCSQHFVHLLPNLKVKENSEKFRGKISLRTENEIVDALDLYYCLHWWIRESELSHKEIPAFILPNLIVKRRRALEWLVGTEGWDDASLDT